MSRTGEAPAAVTAGEAGRDGPAGAAPPAAAASPASAPLASDAATRIGTLYSEAVARLREAGAGSATGSGPAIPTPELDARLLLAEATGAGPAEIHRHSARPVAGNQIETFAGLLERRIAGEPVHRIIGRRAFYEHEFALSPETLEPRPETEILVEVARPLVEAAIAASGRCLFADVGTGTGAIAVSLLALCPAAEAVAIDISEGALATARRNAGTAGVADRFFPVRADHLSPLGGRFDLIVSNPPYIPTSEIAELDIGVRRHDPMLALDGGADGLDAYRAIAGDAARLLRPGGAVILEIGQGQADGVEALFAAGGFAASRRTRDLSGIERVLTLTRDADPVSKLS